jgi:hypothetical protein
LKVKQKYACKITVPFGKYFEVDVNDEAILQMRLAQPEEFAGVSDDQIRERLSLNANAAIDHIVKTNPEQFKGYHAKQKPMLEAAKNFKRDHPRWAMPAEDLVTIIEAYRQGARYALHAEGIKKARARFPDRYRDYTDEQIVDEVADGMGAVVDEIVAGNPEVFQ